MKSKTNSDFSSVTYQRMSRDDVVKFLDAHKDDAAKLQEIKEKAELEFSKLFPH